MNAALRRQRIIGIVCLGLLGIGLWQYVLAPRFTEPANDAKATVSQTEKANVLGVQYSTLMSKAQSLDAASAQAAQLNVAIPTDAQIPQLQGFIWGVGESVGIADSDTALSQYSSLTDGSTPAATPAASAPAVVSAAAATVYETKITVTATGSYAQVLSFVTELSKAPRTISLGHVAVASAGAKNAGSFTVTIEGLAYATTAIPEAPTAASVLAAGSSPAPTGAAPAVASVPSSAAGQ